MKDITLEELLEAGCHFGHQVNRRNPKADEFIFEARANIHIINLEKTHEGLIAAAKYLQELAKAGGSLMVVGTKRQARGIVKEEAERIKKEGAKNIFYASTRWIGGTFTNFEEVRKNFKKLKELREFLASSKKEGYTKREIGLFEKELGKLESLYGGMADMEELPAAMFIVDANFEKVAISEAIDKQIKTIAIVDTNSDPAVIDYPIPANDDAVGSIKIITEYLIEAWTEGQKEGLKLKVKN